MCCICIQSLVIIIVLLIELSLSVLYYRCLLRSFVTHTFTTTQVGVQTHSLFAADYKQCRLTHKQLLADRGLSLFLSYYCIAYSAFRILQSYRVVSLPAVRELPSQGDIPAVVQVIVYNHSRESSVPNSLVRADAHLHLQSHRYRHSPIHVDGLRYDVIHQPITSSTTLYPIDPIWHVMYFGGETNEIHSYNVDPLAGFLSSWSDKPRQTVGRRPTVGSSIRLDPAFS